MKFWCFVHLWYHHKFHFVFGGGGREVVLRAILAFVAPYLIRLFVNQTLIWSRVRPVWDINCCFSLNVGYGLDWWSCNHRRRICRCLSEKYDLRYSFRFRICFSGSGEEPCVLLSLLDSLGSVEGFGNRIIWFWSSCRPAFAIVCHMSGSYTISFFFGVFVWSVTEIEAKWSNEIWKGMIVLTNLWLTISFQFKIQISIA